MNDVDQIIALIADGASVEDAWDQVIGDRSGKIGKAQIGDKIKTLIAEGYPQKQAIAIAYAMWRGDYEPRTYTPTPMIRSTRPIRVMDHLEGLIRGYIAIWGSPEARDSYDTWFDRTRPPEMDLDLLPIALRYEHGFDGAITYDRIGELFEVGFDEIGIYFLARLDKSSPYFGRVIQELQQGTPEGTLRTSSGTASYIADFYEDGAFKNWPIAEVSLTALPSESRMPDVQLLRSERGSSLEDPDSKRSTIYKPSEQGSAPENGKDIQPQPKETRQMNIEEILAGLPAEATLEDMFLAFLNAGISIEDMQMALDMIKPPEEAAPEESAEEAAASERSAFIEALQTVLDQRAQETEQEQSRSVRQERDRLRRQNALLTAQMTAPPPQRPPRGDTSQRPGNGHISGVQDLRFAHLTAHHMALGHEIMRSRGIQVSDDYRRHLAFKMGELLEAGPKQFRDPVSYHSIRTAFPWRADELMATDISGQGSHWVGVEYVNTLWERIRQAVIFQGLVDRGMMILEVAPGHNSVVVPMETADPTWYKVSEANDLDATQRSEVTVGASSLTTSNATITPAIVKARVIFSEELMEDSLIPVLPRITSQLDMSGAEMVENVFLNGDTETAASTNINLIDGTPGTGITAPVYLASDGALKLALVTNTANARDGGTLDSSDFLETRKLHPDALAADPSNMLFVSDTRTNIKSLELLDLKTQDVFRGATIENGSLSGVWGQPYLVSGQMGLANTAGKISATASNNTKGRLLSLVPKYWALVWKRHLTIESAKDIDSGSTTVVASMRLAFRYRTTEASAVTYNLTV